MQSASAFGRDTLDDPLTFETIQDFSGGEDSFRRSTLIDPNQCQKLVNVIVRDNYEARTRPGADSIPAASTVVSSVDTAALTFIAGAQNTISADTVTGIAVGDVVAGVGITVGTTVSAVDTSGKTVSLSAVTTDASSGDYTFTSAPATSVYSAKYFDTPVYQQLLVSAAKTAVASFQKYEGGKWTDLSALWKPAASNARLAMAQGVDKMLVSDASGELQVYDGAAFTSAGAAGNTNAPIGATILCWHTGRMFASGVGTYPDTVYVSNLLDFGAGKWNLTSRAFRVGSGDGDPIVGMGPMQGYTLFVGKRNSVWLVETNPVTSDTFGGVTAFTAAANPQSVADGIGLVGRDAWCAYGNDVLFMAQDGVRSVQRMQAAAGQWQLQPPISQPIQPYIARINTGAWSGIVAIKYQEFALFFVPLDNSTTNDAVLVYNGRLGKWVGVWTGWSGRCAATTRFTGIPRLVFGDTAGYVNQWKEYASATDDSTYTDNGADYTTTIYTRSLQFGEINNNKTAHNTMMRFTAGNANINLSWVADLTTQKTWTGNFAPTGSILGGPDTLGVDFYLASTSPVKVTKGIRGLPAFNEAYLSIESTSGWFFLRSITAGAFVNPQKEF
jgi:hypothetical protein